MTPALDIQVTLDEATVSRATEATERLLWQIKSDAQLAMGEAYEQVVLNNFGPFGVDRPWPWAPLSPAYAKKVGRTYATLLVSGAMRQQLRVDNDSPDACVVSMSDDGVPYATVHHHGNPDGNAGHPGLPARRVFPMRDDGSPTEYARQRVFDAALEAVREGLKP